MSKETRNKIDRKNLLILVGLCGAYGADPLLAIANYAGRDTDYNSTDRIVYSLLAVSPMEIKYRHLKINFIDQSEYIVHNGQDTILGFNVLEEATRAAGALRAFDPFGTLLERDIMDGDSYMVSSKLALS